MPIAFAASSSPLSAMHCRPYLLDLKKATSAIAKTADTAAMVSVVLRGLQNYRYVIYAVLVLLIINFKPSGLLGEWEFTPRDIARSARKLKRKLGLKKEEN